MVLLDKEWSCRQVAHAILLDDDTIRGWRKLSSRAGSRATRFDAGVRAMPGEQGQMSCLFYATPEEANIARCAEKAGDPGETVARTAGNFPSAAIHWHQKGANYALVGALPEAGLRSLADAVHAHVEAFDER
ncbi:MAG TPA: hypothetical protein VIF02_09600 [Methylocella sp.]